MTLNSFFCLNQNKRFIVLFLIFLFFSINLFILRGESNAYYPYRGVGDRKKIVYLKQMIEESEYIFIGKLTKVEFKDILKSKRDLDWLRKNNFESSLYKINIIETLKEKKETNFSQLFIPYSCLEQDYLMKNIDESPFLVFIKKSKEIFSIGDFQAEVYNLVQDKYGLIHLQGKNNKEVLEEYNKQYNIDIIKNLDDFISVISFVSSKTKNKVILSENGTEIYDKIFNRERRQLKFIFYNKKLSNIEKTGKIYDFLSKENQNFRKNIRSYNHKDLLQAIKFRIENNSKEKLTTKAQLIYDKTWGNKE